MADDRVDGNKDNNPSSLGIIGKVLSSLTSNEENNDAADTTVAGDKNLNHKDRNEDSSSVDNEINYDTRKGSISGIFSRFNSTEDSKNESQNEIESNPSDAEIEISASSAKSTDNLVENAKIETEQKPDGSLGILSNIISSFTSVYQEKNGDQQKNPTSSAVDSLLTEQNPAVQNISAFESSDQINPSSTSGYDENRGESENVPEKMTNQDASEEGSIKKNDSFHERLRRSSSALFTEPQKIDSNELDYVTFVSS